MKKFLLIAFLFLTGCQTEFSFPKYYDSEQTIVFDYPKGMTLQVNGQEIRENYTTVRSANPLIATLSKPGFEDKEIKIESSLTSDEWATNGSGFFLSPPFNTLKGFVKGLDVGTSLVFIGPLKLITAPVGAVIGTGIGLGIDLYNLIIGIPSVLIANPWYEYESEVDFSYEALKPIQ